MVNPMFLKEQRRKSLFVRSGYFVIKEKNKICYLCAATLVRIKYCFKKKCVINNRLRRIPRGYMTQSLIPGMHRREERECHLG